MIAKLSNGVISYAPKKYTFTNPDPEMMKQYAGFKDFVENDKPVFDPETQILEPVYSETETQIVCDWRVKDLEAEAVTDGV